MGLLGVFLVLLLLGLPVLVSLGLSASVYLLMNSSISPEIMASATYGGMDSFTRLSIPLFILAGQIMMTGGVSRRLVNVAKMCFKDPVSGVGNISILSSAFFGAVCGSSAATVSAIGGIMSPEMDRAHYKKAYTAALIAAAGFLGILIPPSGPLVIYAVAADQSVGKLFIAVITTGIMFTVAFIILNRLICRKWVEAEGLKPAVDDGEKVSKLHTLVDAIPALLMPLIILGGIYGGIFTPTEAAAVACIYGLIVSFFIYKSLKLSDLPKIFKASAISSANILLIIGVANFFGRVLTIFKVPQAVATFITGISDNRFVILLIINLFLLILGMFMETATAIVLTTPILLPLVVNLGMDPIHFGIMMIVNLSVGLITPPMALNMFVSSQITDVSIGKMVKPIIPYIAVSVALLLLVIYIPGISMWLPKLLWG
ncbi:MAG: TRAP transporter large permease [Oscillospiraceae bacterium]|nr:TRAP transporter large permease [Oscillospiraceae bacterium]